MSSTHGWRAYFELTRPRLLASSLSDVVAGVALAGGLSEVSGSSLARGLGFSLAIYAGGMVANDVADAAEDARLQRPRPIPEARVSRAGASALMLVLFASALLLAPRELGELPYILLGLVVAYDFVAKHVVAVGAVVLGACRSLNLMSGILLVAPATQFRFGEGTWDAAEGWPWWQSCVLVYGAYTALAVVHGSLEDTPQRASKRSGFVLLTAASLPFVLCLHAPVPLALAAGLAPTLVSALRAPASGEAWVGRRTGVLLRGLARLTFALACGLGAWLEAALLALPAWGLPFLLGRKKRWS